jgi:hypothetical protein
MRQRFNAEEYSKIRDEAKKYFLAKKTGEQDLFTEQSKLFKPIIQSTKELGKSLVSGQNELIEQIGLVPELMKRNLPQLEFRHSSPVQSKSEVDPPVVRVNLDGELLNETHIENLQDMSLELPSEVYERNSIEETLKKISKVNRSLGQYLGTSSKKTEKEKEMYQSQKQTLQIYEKRINALMESKQFEVKHGEGIKMKKLVKLKRGKGRPRTNPDVIYYKKPDELIEKLSMYCAGKQAGNTGLDNYINSILDELLETKVISKKDYDQIFKNARLND